jgi:2-keto-4-pentenoate hydratase
MTENLPQTFDALALAKTLFALRAEGHSKSTSEFPLPPDISIAMQAQNALANLEGASDIAWKVAMSPDQHAVMAQLHPYVETSRDAELPYLAGMKFEVEIAVRLGKDIPVRGKAYSRSEILDAVSEAHLGAELLSSVIVESGKQSFPLYVADRIGNRGYALGPVVSKALVDTVGGTGLKVTMDGTTIYEGPAKHPAGDVLAWLVAYANDDKRPDGSLASGSLITTGALSGAMLLPGPGKVDVVHDGKYTISVLLTEAT